MKTTNDLVNDDFNRFLASIPVDAELTTLGDAYADSQTKAATLLERAETARAELDRIDAQLVEAPTDPSKLLAQRSQQMAALEAYPSLIAEAKRRRVLAHCFYLRRIQDLALSEAGRAQAVVTPHLATLREMRRRLERDDSNGAGLRHIAPPEREAMAQQRAQIFEQIRGDQQQLQLAEEIASLAQGRARMLYGDTLILANPATWADAIEHRTRRSTPAVVRSWV